MDTDKPISKKSSLPSGEKIRVNGSLVDITSVTTPDDSSFYEKTKVIVLGAERGMGSADQDLEAESIAEVQFVDGTTWTGYLGDLPDIFPEKLINRDVTAVNVWQLPMEMHSDDQNRGLIGKAILKMLTVFSPIKKMVKNTATDIALKADGRIIKKEGLYRVDQWFQLTEFSPDEHISGNILLLLHGTISSTEGSFSSLKGETWDTIFKSYSCVLSLEHYTLSKSPFENVLTILASLPRNLTLDILSHSRGGLIGDLLTRFDKQNAAEAYGFSAEEVDALKREDEKLEGILKSITTYAKDKSFTIRHFVRVACPASGTVLLGRRLDHFLNLLLNTLGFFLGSNSNIIYDTVKEFLLDVLHTRTDAQVIPGLWSMVPDSIFQKINNSERHGVNSKLFIIAGDSQMGASFGNTLSVILSNLFYREDNDFVVDTKSMNGGLARATGVYMYLSKNEYTSHFNYFRNDNTRHCIQMGLKGTVGDNQYEFQLLSASPLSRGVDLQLNVLRYTLDSVSGNRPIAIILPGIMGSTLSDTRGHIWLNIPRMIGGAFVNNLKIQSPKISADGVIAKYYQNLGQFLNIDNDVKVYPFDWRKSLSVEVTAFANELERYLEYGHPVNIVAHSMGGLLVKQLILNHAALWERFYRGEKNNLILLGTPWKGSHLIMEVLTGHSKRIKQLELIDLKHNKESILETVNAFPGVFELLPFTNEGFDDLSFWNGLRPYVKNLVVPNTTSLDDYRTYRTKTEFLDLGEAKNKVFYIAGHGDTVQGYRIKKGFFTGHVLQYTTTTEGDGSVTYELGIPKEIPTDNIRYVNVSHGQLANKEDVFGHIANIIKTGQALPINRIRPTNRSVPFLIKDKAEEFVLPSQSADILDTIFDIDDTPVSETNQETLLNVSMVNADLCYSNYPVMIGHLKNGGINSAERNLDIYLNQALSERYKLGFYPNAVGESEIIYLEQNQPKGGLIVGIGNADDLTPYLLSQSVEKAIIKYAFFFRDNAINISNTHVGSTISSVIIGNSYVGLSIADILEAIISGVQRANRKIIKLDNGLVPIEEVEFIDYYEDNAQLGYQVLKSLERSQGEPYIFVRPFRVGQGQKKRISSDPTASLWHVFNTTAIYNDKNCKRPIGLSYSSNSGRARVESEVITSDLRIVEQLSSELSNRPVWDPKFSKSLFELLIPNDFKGILRNQNNVLWKMDEYTAQFPWEMFHYYEERDSSMEEVPTFVSTGLIRKLITEEYRLNSLLVDNDKVIVIGDPDYTGSRFRQLPSAADEGKLVSQLMDENGYQVTSLINKPAPDIIVSLFADTYKIVHIAAHGIYERLDDSCDNRIVAGIVLGDGMFLEPSTINQLSAVPEFVFINCCYSGDMRDLDDKYVRNRPKLAANIGTQLIQMGVKAVVVAGWAVNDAAAHDFARKLYVSLFEGYEFGEAVQLARSLCFNAHRNTNTWGAYQCYGDYYYRLTNKTNPKYYKEEPLVTSSQALVELDNFLSHIRSKLVEVDTSFLNLQKLKERIDRYNLETDKILERYALIYAEIGKFVEAENYMTKLLAKDYADFSVSLIEKSYSVSAKLLLEQHLEASILPNSSLKQNQESQMKAIVAKSHNILSFGETSDRLAHVGSMYKRALIMIKNDNSLLQEMLRLFKNSYVKSMLSQQFVDQVYALTNYLLAEYVLGNTPASDHEFDVWAERLKAERTDYTNYYQFNALAKVMGCRFVITKDKAKTEEYFNTFEIEMMRSLKIYGNVKHVKGEIEHLLFMCAIVTNPDKIKMLDTLKERVRDLLK